VGEETLQPKTDLLALKKVDRLNEKVLILSFEELIPEGIKVGDGVENLTWTPSVVLENNRVGNNRARGFLLSTPKRIEVRNNFFSTQKAAIRISSDLKLWNESGAVQDVLIEGNVFEDCVFGGGGTQAVILIDPEIESLSQDVAFGRNVTIRNNIFRTFDNAIVYARSIDGLSIVDNRIFETSTYPKIAHDENHFKIEYCMNVVLQGNRFKPLHGPEVVPSVTK
jgi:hypothetical protein